MRPPAVLLLMAITLTLSGCFTSGADFGSDAESYIEGDESLRAELFPDGDTTFDDAICVDPPSSDVGETFTCAATDSDGGIWEFQVEITGSSSYDITDSRRP